MTVITIPHLYTPRQYQAATFSCLDRGYKRGVSVWHRRAGKDKTYLNIVAKEAFKRRGIYYYILPYYKQARLAIWEGIDKTGIKFLDHFPEPLIEKKDNQDMKIEFKNGSIFRLLGSDNIDSIVGTNPVGIVFSEFSLHKIAAWNYMRPILQENGGWALFNGTPRGKNHLYKMLKHAQQDASWFWEMLTIQDTGVVTMEQIEQERSEGVPEAIIQQEYYCSFDAALSGAYYGDLLNEGMPGAAKTGTYPWDPTKVVKTAWDLGMNDHLVIWFIQEVDNGYHVIDCYANRLQGLEHYVKIMKEKPYVYGEHILPHDVAVRELGTGKSRLRTLRELGLKNLRVAAKISLNEGIQMVRQVLPRCCFDSTMCAVGLEGLKGYRSEFDDRHDVLRITPVHDWCSHYADAFRTFAVGGTKKRMNEVLRSQHTAIGTAHDPLGDYLAKPFDPFNEKFSTQQTTAIY